MRAWLQALGKVTGYSESFLFRALSTQGDWERELGIDRTKRGRAIRKLSWDLRQRAEAAHLKEKTSCEAWLKVLGPPLLVEDESSSALAPGLGDASEKFSQLTLKPEDLTEERIRTALLEVVLQKTGYEASLLRWDADLERDLGIDSVKQAQILGALRKRYPLEFKQGLRLKDFPTLNHWVSLTQQSLQDLPSLPGSDPKSPGVLDARVPGVDCWEVGWVNSARVSGAPLRGPFGAWKSFGIGTPSHRLRDSGEWQQTLLSQKDLTQAGAAGVGIWIEVGAAPAAALSREVWRGLEFLRIEYQSGNGPLFVVVESASLDAPLAAALCGALRSLKQEWGERLEWIALAGGAHVQAADVFQEILQAPEGLEVDWNFAGQRRIRRERRLEALDAGSGSSRWFQASARTLIVGGVQGVGEEAAAMLLTQLGASVTLWGRRPAENSSVQKTCERLHSIARIHESKFQYEAVDVLDLDSVRAAISREGAQRDGESHYRAVIFTAGLIEDQDFLEKQEASFHRVFETKTVGLSNLIRALAERESVPEKFPKDWALFSSFSARRGNPKQVDYAAANEAMRAIGVDLSISYPAAQICVFDWGAWADVGMAARSGLARFLSDAGEPLLSVASGLDVLFSEFAESELQGTAGIGKISGGLRELLVLPTWVSEVRASQAAHEFSGAPLLEKGSFFSRGVYRAQAALDPLRDRWLSEHTVFDDPLMPAVFGIEFLAELAVATVSARAGEPWHLRSMTGLQIESGVAVLGSEPLPVQLEATSISVGRSRGLVAGALSLVGGRRCYSATVCLEAGAPNGEEFGKSLLQSEATLAQEEFLRRLGPEGLERATYAPAKQVYSQIRLGPSFQILDECYAYPDRVAVGFSAHSDSIVRWPFRETTVSRECFDWLATPALLEAAFHCAAWIGLAGAGRVIVPRAVGAIHWLNPTTPGAKRGFMAREVSSLEPGIFELWVFEWVASEWRPVMSVERYQTYDVTGISRWGGEKA